MTVTETSPEEKRRLNVLVADPIEAEQRLIVALLEDQGHHATLALNGRKAVEAVMHQTFDLILMDAHMPVMDGLRATRHIRGLPPPKSDMPIIALIAEGSAETESLCRAAGMDGHLHKPLAASTLLPAIQVLTVRGRPRPAAPDRLPALDLSVIDALREFLSPDQVKALLADSLVDIEARMRRLELRLNDADSAGAAQEAHDLVSVAGNCGAQALSLLARDIERLCKQGAVAAAAERFAGSARIAADANRAIAHLIETVAEK